MLGLRAPISRFTRKGVASYLLLAIVALSMMACSVSDRVVREDSEGAVPETFFLTVKRNKTPKDWILKNLGPPYHYESYADNIEVLSYRFSRTRYRKASALIVFNMHGSDGGVEYYHVLVCDNVVKKAWFDDLEFTQTKRVVRKSRCKKKMADVAPVKDDLKSMPVMSKASSEGAAASNLDVFSPAKQQPEKGAIIADDSEAVATSSPGQVIPVTTETVTPTP